MKKEVIFVLLDKYADWEAAYVASMLNFGLDGSGETNYVVKTFALSAEPVTSIGGFRTLPDYTPETLPADYAALILVGGLSWFAPEAEQIVPLVKAAMEREILVAGICNASVFLGTHGLLNDRPHTSNTLEYLEKYAGQTYAGSAHYVERQAVCGGNIVTANGTAALEFAREVMLWLEPESREKIEQFCLFHKNGFCKE